ncbi:hypothetical protein F4604DRAFT_1878918 [Suillus subluteus]|nr:hypothetical protein F4604DRAFT_1878918 [Suillus subluteus]
MGYDSVTPDILHQLHKGWTGTEHHEMQHVFLGVLAGAVQPTIFCAVYAVLDFIFYAQFHFHMSQTLNTLKNTLDEFHEHKHIFKDFGVHDNFNISKLHLMTHYIESIKSCGSANEHLHIDFAKNAYCVMNRRDYIAQMTK